MSNDEKQSPTLGYVTPRGVFRFLQLPSADVFEWVFNSFLSLTPPRFKGATVGHDQ
jgi:hypothetical protein